MEKTFQYKFDELLISSQDIEEILGFEDGKVPDPFPDLIQEGISTAPDFCDIRGGYKLFDNVKINTEFNTIQLESQQFLPGKIVVNQVKNSVQAALFVSTAGSSISVQSAKISAERDPMLGYILDVIGSIVVDKAVDKIEMELINEIEPAGNGISDRFSPGYCDWSVEDQQKLFALLPEKFCGISLSDSSLMDPIKSVSGIIGVGPDLRQKGYQCLWCTDDGCFYGKIRRKKKR